MIAEILAILNKILYYYPIKISIFLTLCFLWIGIYNLSTYKVSIDYKIYWLKVNWLAVISYISIYIILLLILRYYTWGKAVDLFEIFRKSYAFILEHDIILSLFLFTLAVLFIIMMLRIRTSLTKELIKRHLWAMYIYYRNPTYRIYNTCIETYVDKYSYRKIIRITFDLFIYRLMLKIITKLFNSNNPRFIKVKQYIDKRSFVYIYINA